GFFYASRTESNRAAGRSPQNGSSGSILARGYSRTGHQKTSQLKLGGFFFAADETQKALHHTMQGLLLCFYDMFYGSCRPSCAAARHARPRPSMGKAASASSWRRAERTVTATPMARATPRRIRGTRRAASAAGA